MEQRLGSAHHGSSAQELDSALLKGTMLQCSSARWGHGAEALGQPPEGVSVPTLGVIIT